MLLCYGILYHGYIFQNKSKDYKACNFKDILQYYRLMYKLKKRINMYDYKNRRKK